jgi:hypothetical protein
MREAFMALDTHALVAACAACAPYAAALAVTLVLAAWLTPRRWWRRPNLRALAVLGGGTLAFGALFGALPGAFSGALASAAPAATQTMLPALAAQAPDAASSGGAASRTARPAAGASYRVAYALNLRRAGGVDAARVAVLPAGVLVVATGAVDGDWWQVRVGADGAGREGWASSLWLRRTDERDGPDASGARLR